MQQIMTNNFHVQVVNLQPVIPYMYASVCVFELQVHLAKYECSNVVHTHTDKMYKKICLQTHYVMQSQIILELIYAAKTVENHQTGVDVDIENFMFTNNLASLAALAAIARVNALSLSLALVTQRLHLLN